MILLYNGIIIFILIVFIINSYFLSVKQNIIKITSFIFRIILSWILAKNFAHLLLKLKISNEKYQYSINQEVINNISDVIKVLIIKNFPELKPIILERSITSNIIDSFSLVALRTILLIIIFIIITMIYKIIMLIIKKKNKNLKKEELEISRSRGLIFGIVQGLIIIFLISVPLSGVSALTNEITRLDDNVEYSKEIKFFKDYRKTITGRVFNFFNVNYKPFDTYFFDKALTIQLRGEKIYISEEVKGYVDIVKILEEKDLDKVDLELLDQLDKEFIDDLIAKLKDLKSVNITIPLIIDYVLLNYYQISLDDSLYEVNYYNELIWIGEILILYQNNKDKLDIKSYNDIDLYLALDLLTILSKFELLDKLSSKITEQIIDNDLIKESLRSYEVSGINLDNVNYKKETTIIKDILYLILEIDSKFSEYSVEKISELLVSSDLVKDNQSILLEVLIENILADYRHEIVRVELDHNDYKSFIKVGKALLDNGFLEPNFRLAKLYDERTIEVLIDAILTSNLLRNNLNTIFKLYLKEVKLEIDINLDIPEELKSNNEEGKDELRKLLRLFQILNYGINQENFEKHLDEICEIIRNSSVIKTNFYKIIEWGLEKYNPTEYKVHVEKIDFYSPEGEEEIEKLLTIFRLLVNKKIIDGDISGILKLSKEEIDIILSSKILEEAAIHLLYDLGQDKDIPIVVNFKPGSSEWYKSSAGDGELRYLIYAIRIIFKDVESVDDIDFTPELILSIDDGTIDTNGDGVIDEHDENELYEIMKSKIISDSIIKFIYDYFKDMYKKDPSKN